MDTRFTRFRYLCLASVCLTTIFITIASGGVWAAPPKTVTAQGTPLASGNGGFVQPIDVVVVLDDSGSMATCWPWPRDGGQPFYPPCNSRSPNPPSDPDNLRYSAARLLLQLAADNDRIAVVRFDSTAEAVGQLGSLQPVGPTDDRRRLADSLNPPTDYLRRGYTRIDLGLQAAAERLAAAREPGRNQFVLLLTDGEPSSPEGFGRQGDAIRAQVATLRDAGVLIFPVVLCNPNAGCAGEFLTEELPELGARQATTPQELLLVFSEIFSEMKPDLSIITGRNSGAIQLTTRAAHGVRQLAFVAARDTLVGVRRDDEPVPVQGALNDPLIDIYAANGESPMPGRWIAEMNDSGGFAVVRSDSYPQLLNPPPSLANSAASVRYFPAGKPLLLIARSGGPGMDEPLLYDGKTPLRPFAQTDLKTLLVNNAPATVSLQLGDDQAPLQLVRTFRLEARTDLPRAEVFSPSPRGAGLLPDGHADLQVGFGSGVEVENLAASVFVTDESNDDAGRGQLVFQAAMSCSQRLCRNDDFIPGDGRSYQVTYVVQAVKDGLRFSDWAQAELELKPAIQIVGLPAQLDLTQMPEEGWPVEIVAGTTEPIGRLIGVIDLRRADNEETAPGVRLRFDEEVPDTGSAPALLRVDGLDGLRPGDYVGELTFRATRPSGQPMEVAIRPAPALPVTFRVARPLALVDTQLVDFGELLFDTSPNFRLDEDRLIPVNFLGKRFRITATLQASSCADLTLSSGDVREEDGQMGLPLRLNSRGPIAPTTCSGVIQFSGPDGDHDVFPQQVDWQVRVDDVEWSLVGGDLDLGDLQDAGSRVEAMLDVRFTGKVPFQVQMMGLAAEGNGDDGPVTLTAADLEMAPVEVRGPPDANGVYAVPVTLTLNRALPRDWLRSDFFAGKLTLGVVGLPNKTQNVNFTFRSPGVTQRYISPYVAPIYARLPWALCAWPLTLFLLLVAVARIRGRGIDEVEIDEAAVAPTPPLAPTPAAEFSGAAGAAFATPASLENVWGNADWGGELTESERASVVEPPAGANQSGNDPWRSSW